MSGSIIANLVFDVNKGCWCIDLSLKIVYNNSLAFNMLLGHEHWRICMAEKTTHVPAARDEAVIAEVRKTTEAIAAALRGDSKAAQDAMSEVHQNRSAGSNS